MGMGIRTSLDGVWGSAHVHNLVTGILAIEIRSSNPEKEADPKADPKLLRLMTYNFFFIP
jgi:hypothetical protein